MKGQLYFSVAFNTFTEGCLTELVYFRNSVAHFLPFMPWNALGQFWPQTIMDTHFVTQSEWVVTLAAGLHVVIMDTTEAFC